VASLKDRLTKLEGKVPKAVVPFVVAYREGEAVEEAEERALDGRARPAAWWYVLVPEMVSLEEWEAAHSPAP